MPPVDFLLKDEQCHVVEHGDHRLYLFPNQLDWLIQLRSSPALKHPEPIARNVNYDFARNEFDQLLICVTNRCNIVCDYCFRGFNMREKDELSFEQFKVVADHFLVNAKHKPTFQFTGGEVFVKSDIEDWFEYIHELGFRIWMTTNGVSEKIKSERMRRVFENNPKVHIRVSCDGHVADLYELHRGVPGTFKKVEENLRYLVSIGQRPSVKTVVTRDNFPHLENILEWAHDLGLSGWNYNVVRYTGAMSDQPPPESTAKRKDDIDYVSYVEIGRQLVDIVNRKPWLGYLLGISRFGKILDTLYGSEPHGVRMVYYALSHDGEVYLNDNLYVPEYSRGNVHRDGLKAFNGFKKYRNDLDLDLEACKRCPIHRFCFQKGDYGELHDRDSSMKSEFPNCDDLRAHFFEMMSLKEEGARLTEVVNRLPASRQQPH